MSGRDTILGALRSALHRQGATEAAQATVDARLAAATRGIVPARATMPHARQVDLFCQWATTLNATVARVGASDVPGAVTAYLSSNNLPSQLVMPETSSLDEFAWSSRPMLQIRRGLPQDSDEVGLTGAFAGVAETGTLVMVSGPEHPVSLNLLPETHIVVLRERDIVGSYEDAWDRLRARYGKGVMPRTVNTITGPSRTADIEQTLELGAHGPCRLHIVVVEEQTTTSSGVKAAP